MSVSNSIFQQICPACATSIPINAQRCECGHDLSGDGSSLEASLRDEELYENYLIARAEQAREAALVAKRTSEEEPGNTALQEAAILAKEVADSLEQDLNDQRTKVQHLRALLPQPVVTQTPAATLPAVSTVAMPQATQTPGKPAAKSAEPAKATQAKAPKTPPSVAVIVTPTPITDRTPVEDIKDTPAWTTSSHAGMAKASHALSALKQAKAREGQEQLAALRAQIAQQKKAEQEKLEKAAHEAEQQRQAQISAMPPTTFREEQAARAERAMQDHAQLSGKDCPNCTARVPTNTARCQCGYAFVNSDTELPSLTLCTGDFTALRNTFLNNLQGRR